VPPLPVVPSVIRLDYKQVYVENANILNRIFFKYAGAVSQADCATFVVTAASYWPTSMFSVNAVLSQVTATDLSSLSGARAVTAVNFPGTLATPDLPAEVSFDMEYVIARRYRGGKPKTFLTGRPASDLSDEERWLAARITSNVSNWQTFINNVATHAPAGMGALTHVSVSYYAGFTVITNPITHRARNVPSLRGAPVVDTIIGYKGDARPGSQRRRALQGS
jgi:hypothetical protein